MVVLCVFSIHLKDKHEITALNEVHEGGPHCVFDSDLKEEERGLHNC